MKIARWLLAAFLLVILGGSLLLTLSPDLTRWPVAPTQPAPEKGSVTLTYLGTSTILISDGHTHLLTDGYFSRVSIPRLLFTRIAPNTQRIEHALVDAVARAVAAGPLKRMRERREAVWGAKDRTAA